ncbi:MAG: SUMF1/EgtB/PvdO family nonheme iron enzyme [Nitrospira sp. CR1.1]|jgi:formylglycine-generating enzyme required for sulfatase activity|nr:SUMF1/EgtB/PvdO family nonheme iron enzyme [Nitrospira sp. CR1.1]
MIGIGLWAASSPDRLSKPTVTARTQVQIFMGGVSTTSPSSTAIMRPLRVALLTCLLVIAPLCPAESAGGLLEQLRHPRPSLETQAYPEVPMAMVPEGVFRMGANGTDALEDEKPQHEVWIDRFEIDRDEVTTGHYAEFLASTKHPAPWQWESVDLSQHYDRPVIGVNWFDAAAYCEWRGKRLPTEAEWEKAARGIDGRLFPWGNQSPREESANFGLGARFSYSQVLVPVERYEQGRSPYGLYQMAGNAGEWVADWYGANYYETGSRNNPSGPDVGLFRVVRGGSWSDLPKYLLTYGRFKLPPETRNSYTGFRCARSGGPTASP